MPDSTAKLSQKQKDDIKKWMEDRATRESSKCPVCAKREWIIGDFLIRTPVYTPRVIVMGGPAYAFVLIFCAHCGYTRFFNAVMMELVPAAEEKQDGQK